MTFATKIKLRAGLPASYLLAVTIFTVSICLVLGFRAYHSEVSWLWVGCISFITVIVLLRFYLSNKAQQSLFLLLDSDTSVLHLVPVSDQYSDGMLVISARFVHQTQSLIFANLKIIDGSKSNIVFHKRLNDEDMFRRFGVHEKWGQINTNNSTTVDSKI